MSRKLSLNSQLSFLFRGIFLQLFCLALAIFGPIYWLGILPKIDFSFVYFRGEKAEVRGKVIHVVDTNFNRGGSQTGKRHSGTSIYRFDYEFPLTEGKVCSGSSFAEGRKFAVGDLVKVEYLKANPEYSHIKGLRFNVAELSSFTVTLVPITFSLIVIVLIGQNAKFLRLLKYGQLTLAELKESSWKYVGDTKVKEYTGVYLYAVDEENDARVTYSTTTVLEDCILLVYDSQKPTSYRRLRDLEKLGFAEECFSDEQSFKASTFLYSVIPSLMVLVNLYAIGVGILRIL